MRIRDLEDSEWLLGRVRALNESINSSVTYITENKHAVVRPRDLSVMGSQDLCYLEYACTLDTGCGKPQHAPYG